MDVAFRIQQDIIRFEIPMNDTLGMDILQGTAKLSHPKAYCFLSEALSGNVESKVTTVHEIDHNVARTKSTVWLISCECIWD